MVPMELVVEKNTDGDNQNRDTFKQNRDTFLHGSPPCTRERQFRSCNEGEWYPRSSNGTGGMPAKLVMSFSVLQTISFGAYGRVLFDIVSGSYQSFGRSRV